MGIAMKLSDYLKEHDVQFDLVQHPHSGCSAETAKASDVPAERVAKAVVLEDGRHAVLAVLPASRRLQMRELRARSGPELHLATETKLKYLFQDCEPGAVPPLGG